MDSYHGRRTEVVRYGPQTPTEAELRLLPDVSGKRVLELGSGSRSSAVALARQGAHVIAVDPSPRRLAEARTLAEEHEARAEWHESPLEELAFLRADSVDVAFSAGAVLEVPDVSRLFRQVHRVLNPDAAFVFAYQHPARLIVAGRGYWDEVPIPLEVDGETVEQHPRPISEVHSALHRAGFRTEVIAEPEPVGGGTVPPTIIWRARKEGV